MKVFLSILICKAAKLFLNLIGRGSSMPGAFALKICPDILKRVSLPKTIIAVTGSNGKTSTVEMIAHVLASSGKRVAYNKEGSNQIQGVTALILTNCTFKGAFKKDILLIESDERYAKHSFKYFTPTHYVITNLYRDQLTRNGHPLFVYEAIKESIPPSCSLILNADDPLVSSFGIGHEKVTYFGMEKQSFSHGENIGMYDDGAFCPVCQGRMEYSYRHYNHIGYYKCTECSFAKPDAKYKITEADLEKGILTIDGEYKITLSFKSIYNAYNILACYALLSEIGLSPDITAEKISGYVLKNGRVVNFIIGKSVGTLITSKHENSVSYDQSLTYIASQMEERAVIVLVDAVSRKYFTSETSWLWDIDFDKLNLDSITDIYLLGKYASDLAVRFSYTDIDQNKINICHDIKEGMENIRNACHERIYAVTCFSDKDKLLNETEVL